jgi:hypothetical protein
VGTPGKPTTAFCPYAAICFALRTNIRDEASLERILKKTNQIIYELTDDERFAFSFTQPSILLRAICLTSSRKRDRCHL